MDESSKFAGRIKGERVTGIKYIPCFVVDLPASVKQAEVHSDSSSSTALVNTRRKAAAQVSQLNILNEEIIAIFVLKMMMSIVLGEL